MQQPSTGLTGLDDMIHGLRAGDNVVLRVDSIDDYLPFVEPYVQRVLAEGRKFIYFRFSRHRRLIPEIKGVKTITVHPEIGFERFLTEIIDEIEAAGHGAFYLFDCLSELAVDWYSDRMLANFFMITCPYLYQLDTIAYFALLKHHHSSHATDGIHVTAQVIMDVYRNRDLLYVQPLKVYGRYSPTMFLVHSWTGEAFVPVTSSAILSEIFAGVPHTWLDFSINRPGVWTRTFMDAQKTLTEVQNGSLPQSEAVDFAHRLIRMAVTREPRVAELARRYFTLEDLIRLLKRMIGTGQIGGKSLGMLLSRAILTKQAPRWNEKLEAHDSFYIGSDAFYTYIVQNGCWWLRRRQKNEDLDDYLTRADAAREKMMSGQFPEHIERQFMEMLDYFGQSPIIVRSSSLLEDSYGNAFSGKYESVFCANQGTPQDRLQNFMSAVREVYASSMSRDALVYRAQRGLLDRDEQMALLVQRVSGAAYGDKFFPHVSGVGYSFNTFVWNEEIDPHAGMLRLVFGLGTRAVERTEDDYTRLIALNAPTKQPYHSEDMQRYVQRYVDVLDLSGNRNSTLRFEDIEVQAIGQPLSIFASRDRALEERARQHGMTSIFPWNLTFDRLISRTEFIEDMRSLLATLKAAYNCEVDIEFTGNFFDEDNYLINLVQCRPFQVKILGSAAGGSLATPRTALETLFETKGPVIGQSTLTAVDTLIYVVPSTYSMLPEGERYAVARALGQITKAVSGEGRTTLLVGPGRWGTSTPSLGVPVSFSEINTVSIICEVALMHAGLVPDISLGTHFFNDLVELDMLYLAILPGKDGHILNQDFFAGVRNRLAELAPSSARYEDVIKVCDASCLGGGKLIELHVDSMKQTATCCVAGAVKD